MFRKIKFEPVSMEKTCGNLFLAIGMKLSMTCVNALKLKTTKNKTQNWDNRLVGKKQSTP